MKIFTLLFLTACASAFAQTDWGTITLVNSAGVTITNARVLKVDSGKLMYVSDNGGGTVAIADLPPDVQKRFGYSSQQDDSDTAIRKWARMLAASSAAKLGDVQTNAEQGNLSAMIALGDFFYAKWKKQDDADLSTSMRSGKIDPSTGLPVSNVHATNNANYLKGMDWYEKAASLSNSSAMWRIITNEYGGGTSGFSLDPTTQLPLSVGNQGLTWLKALAGQSDQRAIKILASYSTNFDSVLAKSGLPVLPDSSSTNDGSLPLPSAIPAKPALI